MKYSVINDLISEQTMRVGKRVNGVYVQYNAIIRNESNLTDNEIKLVNRAVKFLPKGFDLDFIWTDGVSKVRMMKMSDLTEAHPYVVESYIFDNKTRDIKPGKTQKQIYHRLETIMSPSDPTYGFHKRVTEYEMMAGLLGKDKPKGIGFERVWKDWIEENGIPYEQYLETIENLR